MRLKALNLPGGGPDDLASMASKRTSDISKASMLSRGKISLRSNVTQASGGARSVRSDRMSTLNA